MSPSSRQREFAGGRRQTAPAARPPGYADIPSTNFNSMSRPLPPATRYDGKYAPPKIYPPSTSPLSTSEVRLINGVDRFCAVVTRHKVLLISAPLKRVTASFSG